jgi:hypothetical protein
MDIDIRPAQPAQAGLILAFIRRLADYEKRLESVVVTEKRWPSTCSASVRGPRRASRFSLKRRLASRCSFPFIRRSGAHGTVH